MSIELKKSQKRDLNEQESKQKTLGTNKCKLEKNKKINKKQKQMNNYKIK